MFKLHRHRSDRLGERVEFRFSSFQAFQIPKGWDRLVLSLVSVETGKAIAKANKATVRSGTCQWTEIFSESIWVPHDGTSKDIDECAFKLVVSMGSHRSGILGELPINLTDYISLQDSGSLSLPLKRCNYGTILQVRIQCLNPKRGFREGRSSKETSTSLEGLHTNNGGTYGKSDGSENMFNRSLVSSGVTYPEEPVNQDKSFSASGSHRSSDSGDSSVGRLNFSPKSNLNGGSQMGRQDSAGSHVSAASSVGPAEEFSRSTPSSFNSRASGSTTPNRWQESTMQNSAHVLAPILLRPSGSPKDFLEAAEETIEELQDEAKMWERHAQKLKLDIEKLKKESADKSKRQAELDVELSATCAERDSLKQEVEELKLILEATRQQTTTRTSKNEVMLCVQKELEAELKNLKESNADLNLQLRNSQDANIELFSILKEFEETIEKQRLEIENLQQQSPVGEYEGDVRSHGNESEWESKLSAKEEEIRMLEEKLSGMLNAEYPSEKELSRDYPDLIKEIDDLRIKVQELEKDCTELTDENLELIYKMKESGKHIMGERDFENSGSEVDFLRSQIHKLEEEVRRKEMLNGGLSDASAVQMKNLEKKCAELESELQYFKGQASLLDIKLRESQLEVEEKITEFSELQKKLQSFQCNELGVFDAVIGVKEVEALEGICKKNAGNESDKDELKFALSSKEKEVDDLRHTKEELEVLVTNIQRDKTQLEENLASVRRESSLTSKCLQDVQHEMMLLATSVDSHTVSNKMLERKAMELESSKHELEIQVSELEEENIQLSERISGLEAQLRYLTNEKESNRLELGDARSLAEDLKDEVTNLRDEIETQKGELQQKLLDAQKKLSEAQEEAEYLKRSHSKLQSTIDSFMEENNSLQKLNGDLRRQKLDLHERSAYLEVELSESKKKTSEFLKKVEFLELKLSSMQNDIVSKEKMLTSQLESIFQQHEDQEEKISQAKLMFNMIDGKNTVEMDNHKREIAHLSSQLCATHDERQRMASDAVLEVSNLRLDKTKLENSLQEAIAKTKLYETDLQSLRQESGKKVQGLVDLLSASKQSEEMMMSDIEHLQRQCESAKSGEERFKRVATELELKLKTSDYEKQQIMEEISSLNLQVQKVAQLQDEIFVLKSSFEEVRFEKGKLEESLESAYDESEGLKKERTLLMEKISNMQKALHNSEDDRRSKIALEEKILRLEGDLTAKEVSRAQETELKNEINRIKRANNEYQRKIQCLEEENCELMKKSQALKNGESQDKDDSKLHDLEATIQELEAKIHLLKDELAESLQKNNTYKIQLQGLMEEKEKQSGNDEVPKKSMGGTDKGLQQGGSTASLEAELKEMRERYSNMSLQYAEVEAQRAELVLKLKATATPKGNKGWFS